MYSSCRASPPRAQTSVVGKGYSCETCGASLPRNCAGRGPRFRCDACRKTAFRALSPASRFDGRGPAGKGGIRAELIGSDTATALGHSVTAYAPVLELCRALVAAGHDPVAPMQAYRGPTLCLIVRAIGEAAGLEINSKGTGLIRRRAVRTASPIAPNASGAPPETERAPAAIAGTKNGATRGGRA